MSLNGYIASMPMSGKSQGVSQGGCCAGGHQAYKTITYSSGKKIYAEQVGRQIHIVSLDQFDSAFISERLGGYRPLEDGGEQFSLQTRLTILALFVFGIGNVLSGAGYLLFWQELVLNESVLAVIIWPYFQQLASSAKQSLAGFAIAVLNLYFLPYGLMSGILCSVIASVSFYWLISDGHVHRHSLLAVALWQIAVQLGVVYISPWLLLLAPLSAVYNIVYVDNPKLNCSFALTLVVLLSMAVAAASYLLGLGHVVCLHDAVTAALMIFSKDVVTGAVKQKQTLRSFQEGDQIEYDLNLIDHKNLTFNLGQATTAEINQRKLMQQELQAEESYSPSDLAEGKRIIPKGARIVSGSAVGVYSADDQAVEYQSEFNKLIMYMVPACALIAVFSSQVSYLLSLSAAVAIGIGLQTLLAACPCIFLVVPYIEYRASSTIAHYLNVEKGDEPTVNFRNKLFSSFRWGSLKNFSWLFDRTQTTHFPVPGNGEAPYQFNEIAKRFMQHLVTWVGADHIHALSGSGAYYKEAYISDLTDIGMKDANVHTDARYSTTCCAKRGGFDKSIKDKLQGRSMAAFVDGDNDAQLVARSGVLGVGIYPTKYTGSRTVLNLRGWGDRKPEDIVAVLQYVCSMQRLSSVLIIEALMVALFATSMPFLSLTVWQISAPMWTSCSIMIGGLAILVAQAEIAMRFIKPAVKGGGKPLVTNCISRFFKQGYDRVIHLIHSSLVDTTKAGVKLF